MHKVKEVEILKADVLIQGTDEYTVQELEEIAKVYNPKLHHAPVIWGHENDNWSGPIKADSVLSNGWVDRLYVKDKSLYCEMRVDDATRLALKEEKLKTRSVGLYSPNSKNSPLPGKYYLRHLALLGSEPPAVKGLNDIKIYKEVMDENESIEFLNEKTAEWLAYAIKDDGNGFGGNITEFMPAPAEDNNWLYDAEAEEYRGQFMTDENLSFDFSIKKEGEDWIISTTMSKESQESLPEDLGGEELAEDITVELAEVENEVVEIDEIADAPLSALRTDDEMHGEMSPANDMQQELSKMKAYIEQMSQELNSLKAEKVKAQDDKAMQYCDCLYDGGHVSESDLKKEAMLSIFKVLLNKEVEYSDNGNSVPVAETIVKLLKANKTYSDAVVSRKGTQTLAPAKVYAKGTDESEMAYQKVRQYMDEKGITNFRDGWVAYKNEQKM
jgi:hypothetical protein